MIPKILHTVLLGPKEPHPSVKVYRDTFQALHPDWQIMQWNDGNISELGLTPEAIFHGTAAGSSNIVRLAALYKFGGVYIDTDVEAIRSFDGLLHHRAFIARQPDGVFCNAVIGAEPEHIWIDEMLGKVIPHQKDNDAAWACHLIQWTDRSEVTELPPDTFYPWGHNQTPKPPTKQTLALHHWEGSWLPAP